MTAKYERLQQLSQQQDFAALVPPLAGFGPDDAQAIVNAHPQADAARLQELYRRYLSQHPDRMKHVEERCGPPPWIIRSAGLEDGDRFVNAGGYASVICLAKTDFAERVAEVVFSGFTAQAIAQQKLDHPDYQPRPIAWFAQRLVEGVPCVAEPSQSPYLTAEDCRELIQRLQQLHQHFAQPALDTEWVLETDLGLVSATAMSLSASDGVRGELALGFGFASAQSPGARVNAVAYYWPASKAPLWHGAQLRQATIMKCWLVQVRPAPGYRLAYQVERLTAATRARLAAALPETASVGAGARVVIYCPALEKRYGTGEAWLPWNAPAMARSRLRRINPRKTPLLITDPSGNPLMHLRFIGENAYGLAEFGRLKQTCAASAQAAFMDGYHITQHLHGLRPLRALLAHANGPERRRWLLQSRHSIENISHPPLARIAGQRSRVGQEPAPALPSWLCSLTIPPFGGSLRPIRSSHRYAWGEWHWQVDTEVGLHRFHQNANWGDVSWPELEIAAFLLVHHLPFETLDLMDDDKHYAPPTVDIVAASLPAAACVILSGINREVRQFSARGKARLREDLSLLAQQLIRYRENILAGTRPGAPVKQA